MKGVIYTTEINGFRVTIYIRSKDGQKELLSEVSNDKLQSFKNYAQMKLSESLSNYYSLSGDEFLKL